MTRPPRFQISNRKRVYYNFKSGVECKECSVDLFHKYCYSQTSLTSQHRCLDCALRMNIITSIPTAIKSWIEENKQEVYA
jgi:hypothetical protein